MSPHPRGHGHRHVHLRVDRDPQGCDPDPQEPGCDHEMSDVHAQPQGGRRLHRILTSGPRSGTDEREYDDALRN